MSDKPSGQKRQEHFIRLYELHINCTMRKIANTVISTQSPTKNAKELPKRKKGSIESEMLYIDQENH